MVELRFHHEGRMMKNLTKNVWMAAVLAATAGSFALAADCDREYMKDPCAQDSYSVVETERHVKGPHNCMACAHYFPGEEPEGYCEGHKGKDAVRARTPVASVH
jgi:hypothetical protein